MKENRKILNIILVTIIVLILIAPILIFVDKVNKEKKYDELVAKITEAAKKYSVNSDDYEVDINTLKEEGFLNSNLVNPKTNRPISNVSYVILSDDYEVKIYDIPKSENVAKLVITFNGDKKMQNGIGVQYEELGINVSDGNEDVYYVIQYFYKGKEVNKIDSSKPKDYEVVYTALNSDGELAKVVREVIVQ